MLLDEVLDAWMHILKEKNLKVYLDKVQLRDYYIRNYVVSWSSPLNKIWNAKGKRFK